MRTVSFSPKKIRQTLSNEFVCHAINTEGDPSAGGSHAHSPSDPAGRCSDGVANQNVQLLFLTPKGEIFHTASGFRGSQAVERELNFARTIFREIQEKPGDAESIVKTQHRKRGIRFPSRSTSRSRNGGGGGSIRRALQFDLAFSQNYPMLTLAKFEENPRILVGNGTSFFTSGTAVGGRIGGS